jgi:uncharacterized membrane protein
MERTDLGRIMAFTDGVMAVAITLLVLNLEVPDVPDAELDDALVDLLPSLAAYVLAFALVGRFWVVHHALFERLRAFDGTLMALNLLYLAAIVLMPFATALYDQHTQESIAAAVFGGVLGLAASINWLMQVHIVRKGLVHEHSREETAVFGGPVALGLSALFVVSVPVAFVSPDLALVLWISTIVLRYPLRKLAARVSSA